MFVRNTKDSSVTKYFALSADKEFDGDYDWAYFDKTPTGYDKIVRVTYCIDFNASLQDVSDITKEMFLQKGLCHEEEQFFEILGTLGAGGVSY